MTLRSFYLTVCTAAALLCGVVSNVSAMPISVPGSPLAIGSPTIFSGSVIGINDFTRPLPDDWNFSVLGPALIVVDITQVGLASFQTELQEDSGSGFVTKATATPPPPSMGPYTLSFADLMPGTDYSYRLLITGSAIGGREGNGSYDFSARLTAPPVSEVPLPGAVWLLISALLGLVSISRVRWSSGQTE